METASLTTDRPRPPRDRRHILVVEDNEGIAAALRAVLARAGYDVTHFAAGLQALRHADEHPPDAAIIDIHLPDINGLVLTQQLRDRLGDQTPLLVLSGDTSIQTINSLPHVGATYFLPKPVQANNLLDRLKEWLQ